MKTHKKVLHPPGANYTDAGLRSPVTADRSLRAPGDLDKGAQCLVDLQWWRPRTRLGGAYLHVL